jgi:hypothetical protein
MTAARALAGATALAACAALVLVAALDGAGAGVPRPRLPDLRQAVPYRISVFTDRVAGRARHRLTFGSAAENVGAGPLIIVGHRPNTRTPTMVADQVADTADPAGGAPGPQVTFRNVGTLRYVVAREHGRVDHQHFHLLRFMRYELRRASDHRLVAPDHKTGFCLGDRYAAGRFDPPPRRQARAADLTPRDFDSDCGLGRPRLLRVIEGISVGQGDDYKPRLEGQFLDITNVPGGRYLLVHRVNGDRRIRESDYANDASSVLIGLRRRGGGLPPAVTVLARCPDRPRCPDASSR